MSIAAGELNRRIVIETLSGAKDALNQPVKDWITFGPPFVWAKYMAQSGIGTIKSADGGVQRSPVQGVWRIRYNTAINDAMRVNFNGVIYDILKVIHDTDRRDYTDLVCETGGNNG